MTRRGRIALKALAWVACLAPLGWLAYLTAIGDLTPNPISFVSPSFTWRRNPGTWLTEPIARNIRSTASLAPPCSGP